MNSSTHPATLQRLIWLSMTVAVSGILAGPTSLAAQNTPPSPSPSTLHALSLGDAARLAANRSASSQTARIRVEEARAQVTQQRADLLPSLSAIGSQETRTMNTASFGISFPSAPGEPPLFDPDGEVVPAFSVIDYRARVTVPLIDFSAFSRLRGAKAAVTASSARATAASEQAAERAAVAYIRALRAEDALRARSEDSVLAADLVAVAQAQLQAGTGIVLDVTRAQAQLAATRADLIASRGARARTRIDLVRALNLPAGTQITLSDSLGSMDITAVSTNEETAIQRALQNRPDLRAAEAQVAAAKQSVSAVRAERLPTLSFMGDKGVNGKNYDHLLNTYAYGFQLSLPILDGFRREGRIEERRGAVREAEVQQHDIEQQAGADVRSALLDLESARQQVSATQERLRLTEQEVTQARERFSAGVAGNADVITALLALTAARTAVIDAQTSYQTARVALAHAEGAVTTLP